MHICPISCNNNNLSFKKIYTSGGFNENQKLVKSDIERKLKTPLPQSSNKTSDEFNKNQESVKSDTESKLKTPSSKSSNNTTESVYESNGWDFMIEPGNTENTVYLTGIKGTKETGTGTNKTITWKESVFIGKYDKEHPFNISDIKTRIQEAADWHSGTTGVLIVAAIGLVVACLAAIFSKKSETSSEVIKPLIENAENLTCAIKRDTGSTKTASFLDVLGK